MIKRKKITAALKEARRAVFLVEVKDEVATLRSEGHSECPFPTDLTVLTPSPKVSVFPFVDDEEWGLVLKKFVTT